MQVSNTLYESGKAEHSLPGLSNKEEYKKITKQLWKADLKDVNIKMK